MIIILGAALIVAAVVLLHLGRIAVLRAGSARRESLISDFFAITFVAVFCAGFLMILVELLRGPSLVHLAESLAALAAALAGAKLVMHLGRHVTALEPPPAPVAAPLADKAPH